MARIVVSCAVACLCSLAVAQDPLPLRIQRGVSLAFLRPVPLGSRILRDGRIETSFRLGVANEMRDVSQVTEDSETWRLAWFTRHAWGDRSEWFLEVPILSRGGGVLDGLIGWYHHLLVDDGVPTRDRFGLGGSQIRLPGSSFSSAAGLGDVTLGAGRDIGAGWALRGWLKVPTGEPDRLLGSGNADAAISLEKQFALTRQLRLDGMSGFVYQGKASSLDNARSLIPVEFLSLAWIKSSRDCIRINWNAESSPTVTGSWKADRQHRVMGLSYTRQTGYGDWSVFYQDDGDFGWTQFPGGASVGPDFTLGLNFRILR